MNVSGFKTTIIKSYRIFSHFCTVHRRFKKTNTGTVTWTDLMEEWTVRDWNPESIKAHSQHHVIRSVIAVAFAATVKKLDHGLPAEHHPTHTQPQGNQHTCTQSSMQKHIDPSSSSSN